MTTAADAVTSAVSAVVAAVSAETGVPGDEILGRQRLANHVEARQLVVYLLRVDYEMTLDRIGRLLDRDPSTVLSAVRQTQRRLRLETHLVETLDEVRAALRAEDPGKCGDEDPGRPATSPAGPYTPPPLGMLHIPRRRPRRGPGVNRRRLLVLILVLAAVLTAGAVRSRSAGVASGPVVFATEGVPPSPPLRASAATSPEAPAEPTTATTYPPPAMSAPAVPATTNAPRSASTSPPVATLEELGAARPPLLITTTAVPPVTTTKAPRSSRWIPTVERWRGLVSEHFRPGDVETALRIIQCESGGDPEAANSRSSARGLFQHLERYWGPTWHGDKIRGGNRAARAGVGDADIFDPVAQTIVAAWLRYKAGGWTHWTCY